MNESAFEQQSRRLWQKAYDTSRSYGADGMEAEDIAQEVMLRLWQMRNELGRFRSPEALVVVVSKRLTLNLNRQKQLLPLDGSALQVAMTGSTPQQLMEEKENEEWLDQRLRQLPSRQYAILWMRQVERRSCDEIARLLGIGETSVRTLLSRARHQLREDLKERR